MFGDKFVLEYVVREFLLLVLLLYQLLVATSGAGDGLESDLPQVKSTAVGNPLINLVSNNGDGDKTLATERRNSQKSHSCESTERTLWQRVDQVHKVLVQTQPAATRSDEADSPGRFSRDACPRVCGILHKTEHVGP